MHFKIWSFRKGAWWRASGGGYTTNRAEAGVYSTQDLRSYNLMDRYDCDTPRGEGLVMIGETEASASSPWRG
jgi:hypothetical protein